MHAPRQVYSFPVMKPAEIISILKELNIEMSDDELQNPEKNKEHTRHILESLAAMCTGITREEMAQPAFSGLSVLNYPELHEESIPQLNSFRAITKMMEICGIQDFSMKDLMAPSSKRLKRQLSGIINFAKFHEERLTLLNELSGSRESLLEKMNYLRSQNEALNSRLATLREQTAEESKIIAKVEQECKEIEENISNLNHHQASIKDECSELKALNNQLKDSLSTASINLDEANALRKKLSGQIVNSPERFRRQIVDVGQSLQTEQKDAKAAEKKLRELTHWVTTIEEVQAEVDGALEGIHDLRAEVGRQKGVISDMENQKGANAAKRNVLEELDQNTSQISRQSSRAEEKLQLLRRQASTRGADTQRAVEDLHKQLIDAESFRVQVRSRSERSEGEALRLERESEAESIAQDQERADMVASYQKLERIVVSHLQSLRRTIESDSACV